MHFQDVHLRSSLEAERVSAELFAEPERMRAGEDQIGWLDCPAEWELGRMDQPAEKGCGADLASDVVVVWMLCLSLWG